VIPAIIAPLVDGPDRFFDSRKEGTAMQQKSIFTQPAGDGHIRLLSFCRTAIQNYEV
jgi:hypothetical protein